MKKQVDNLIVGAGLAGTWLAFHFLQMNKSFALIDKPGLSISSSVAAGIINPLLPARQKKSYNADLIYPFVGKKYQDMERFLNRKLFYNTPVAYVLDDQKSMNDWATLAGTDQFRNYAELKNDTLSPFIKSPFGYLEIRHSGRVDIIAMLDGFKASISPPNYYMEHEFDESLLELSETGVKYHDFTAENIIFCQGAGLLKNTYTSNIPLKPAKGEVLSVTATDELMDKIPQNGVFMLPLEKHAFKVGSNFEWDKLDYEPTEEAKQEILRKLRNWYKGELTIADQKAGLRPSSEDRRPILGRLPGYDNMYLFNGLGSKGAALAPYYSNMISEYIYDFCDLDPEVDIRRLKIR